MRFILISIGLFFLLIHASCTTKHNYVWNVYPIHPDRISSEVKFENGYEVKIIKGKSNEEQIFLGKQTIAYTENKYYGTVQSLTDGLADHLSMELKKRGVKIDKKAKKSLEITVKNIRFEEGNWKTAATINYTIKLGNGEIKSFSTRNSSTGNVAMVYDGVIALAVINILQDSEILKYLIN